MAKKKTPDVPTAAQLIDRTLKREWARALHALESARDAESSQWDALWEAVDAILSHDPPLYLAAGIKTERAFRERHLPGVAQNTMRDNALVARHFDAAAERAYGTTTLALLLRYLAARHGALPAVKIDPAKTTVRVRKGRSVVEVPFARLTYDEMRGALRSATAKRTADSPLVAAVRRSLRAKALADVTLRERSGKLDLMGVEAAALHALGAALGRVKLPAVE